MRRSMFFWEPGVTPVCVMNLLNCKLLHLYSSLSRSFFRHQSWIHHVKCIIYCAGSTYDVLVVISTRFAAGYEHDVKTVKGLSLRKLEPFPLIHINLAIKTEIFSCISRDDEFGLKMGKASIRLLIFGLFMHFRGLQTKEGYRFLKYWST